jgi:hypothetical protein
MPENVPAFGSNINALLQFLKLGDEPTIISPQKFSAVFGLDLLTLARLADVQPFAVMQTPATANLQLFLHNSVRLICASTDISGNVETSLFWFRNHHISCFDGQTPLRLVTAGRVDDVIRYVHSLELGWLG